jgi:hypothetical protein
MPSWLILLFLAPIWAPLVVFVLPVLLLKLMIMGEKDDRPAEARPIAAGVLRRLGLTLVGMLSFKFGYSLAVIAWLGIAPYFLDSARNNPDFSMAHGWLEATLMLATLLWSAETALMGIKLIAFGKVVRRRKATRSGYLEDSVERTRQPVSALLTNVVFGVVALLVVLSTVGETPTPSLHLASTTPTMDFREFTYPVGPPFCEFAGNSVTVHNGKFTDSQTSFEVSQIMHSDLIHEGGPQAIVETECSPNNAANAGADVSLVYVYGLRNGRAVLLGTFADGWPWNFQNKVSEPIRPDGIILGNVTGIHVDDGTISFERFGGHARCCPEINLKRNFRWSNGRFILARETEMPWKEK